VINREDFPRADLGAMSRRPICHMWLHDIDAGRLCRWRYWVGHQQIAARRQL